MAKIHIGCAGWSYKGWQKGEFYPKTLPTTQFLRYYSKFFDFVEVNTSFYHIPSLSTINHWDDLTSDDFRFSIKIWQEITHKRFNNIESKILSFFAPLTALASKIDIFLLQFPPNFSYTEKHLDHLQRIQRYLPKWGTYVYEFRHASWFDPSLLNTLFSSPSHALVTSYLSYLKPYYRQEQSIQYIRIIGDRKLTKFTHIQRKKPEVMEELVNYIRTFQKVPTIEDIFVIFNNHFRGFAPQDVVDLKEALDIQYKKIRKNRSLLDYFSS